MSIQDKKGDQMGSQFFEVDFSKTEMQYGMSLEKIKDIFSRFAP